MRAISILEDALTLLVDDLPALGEREILRVAAARVRLGAHEAIFLRLAADVLLDDAGRLELAAGRVGRGADAEALVFHGLARRRVLGRGLTATAEEPTEKSLQKAHWLISPSAAAFDETVEHHLAACLVEIDGELVAVHSR